MTDFKWTLSRPGIQVEFETGSIAEALGMLEEEGSQLNEVFGLRVGSSSTAAAGVETSSANTATTTDEPAAVGKKRGRPAKPPIEAVAPEPLPIPGVETAPPVLPGTAAPSIAPTAAEMAVPADGGIPPFLQRTAAPPPPALPGLPSVATQTAPPPVGVLGPKVVAALDKHSAGKEDGGQALADWLAEAGLTIKGKTYNEACRAVLMISDEKLTASGILAPLGVA